MPHTLMEIWQIETMHLRARRCVAFLHLAGFLSKLKAESVNDSIERWAKENPDERIAGQSTLVR